MVIPWIDYSLSKLTKKVKPTGNAKHITFNMLADNRQMPGLRSPVLERPYVEGLPMDKAMHSLALRTFVIYGHVLPNHNGAPVRMVLS